jgi:hypothetical protein
MIRDASTSKIAARILAAARTQLPATYLHDPIEDDPQYASAFADADELVDSELSDVPHERGHCHRVWTTRKRILREQFGIDWLSPREMNPGIAFD